MTMHPPPWELPKVSAGLICEGVVRCAFVSEIRSGMGKQRLLLPNPWRRLLVFDRCGISRSRLSVSGLLVQ